MENRYIAVTLRDLSTQPLEKELQGLISGVWNGFLALHFPLTEGYIKVYDRFVASSGTAAANFIIHVVYDVSSFFRWSCLRSCPLLRPISCSSNFPFSLFSHGLLADPELDR
jgi:hypothetical protein